MQLLIAQDTQRYSAYWYKKDITRGPSCGIYPVSFAGDGVLADGVGFGHDLDPPVLVVLHDVAVHLPSKGLFHKRCISSRKKPIILV